MPVTAPISVVIPAHNAAEFIEDAIASVAAQTLPIAELIVVADACSDETAKLAAGVGAIVIEANQRNISAARNHGVRAATQEWIALLDSDDLWEKTKIERQWQAVKAFPDAAIISCDLSALLDGKISKRSAKQLRERRRSVAPAAIVGEDGSYFPQVDGRVLMWYQISPPTALIRRDVFDRVGYFDEQLLYNEDVEFFARSLKHFSLVVIEDALVCNRIRRNSHSTNVQSSWEAYLAIIDRMLRQPDQYPAGAGDEYREKLKRSFLPYERLLAKKRRESSSPTSIFKS